MYVKCLILATFATVFGSVSSAASDLNGCEQILSRIVSRIDTYEVHSATTLRDLEPVFRNLIEGKPFELVIPKNTKPSLSQKEVFHGLRWGARKIDYFPYELAEAKTKDAQYTWDQLYHLERLLGSIEQVQQQNKSLSQLIPHNFENKFFFSTSPSSTKHRAFYRSSEILTELTARIKKHGPNPWIYARKNGDFVVTNQHFFSYLKETGQKTLTLYRGHDAFDYYFYRLLLEKKPNTELRDKFAAWLESELINVYSRRKISEDLLRTYIKRLRDRTESVQNIVSDMSRDMTSRAFFTSLTNENSDYWLGRGPSEVLKLSLDLNRLDETYLPEIMFGADKEIEIVFPFVTSAQRDSLTKALRIESSESRGF